MSVTIVTMMRRKSRYVAYVRAWPPNNPGETVVVVAGTVDVVVEVVVVVLGALPAARTCEASCAPAQPGVGVAVATGVSVGAWGMPNSTVEMAFAITV